MGFDIFKKPEEQVNVFGEKAPNIFGGGDTEPDIFAAERKQIEESLPWWYKVANFVSRGIEPITYVGSVGRAAAFDIFFRRPGEPSELRRILTIENVLKAAPFGDVPDEAVPGTELAELIGVKDDGFKKFAAGFILEAAFDPLNWLTLGGSAAIRTAMRGASEVAKAKGLGRLVTAEDMMRAARELEKVGDKDAAKLMRYAVLRRSGEKMISPSAWVPEPTRRAMERAFVNILDKIPTPFTRELVTETGVTKVPMSLAEFIMTPGSYARGIARSEDEVRAAGQLFGSADVVQLGLMKESSAQSALFDRASGLGNYIAARGLVLARNVPRTFEEVTGKSVEEAKDLYDVWSKAIADWLDHINADLEPSILPLVSGKKPGEELAEKALKTSSWRRVAYARIKQYAKAVGADQNALFNAAERLAREHYLYAAEIGYYLSRMPEYLSAIDDVAKEIGARSIDIRIALTKRALGKGLTETEEALVTKAKELLAKKPLFQSIEPEEYIKNLQEGYYRRVLGLHLDDPDVMRRVMQGAANGVRWYPAREIDAEKLVDYLGEVAGDEAANRLASFIAAYGDGALSIQQLSRYSGISEEVIADALKELNVREIGGEFRDVIEKTLLPRSDKRPAFGLVGRRLFQERTLPDIFEADLLPISGLAERTAALASSGRRAITGQEIVAGIYNELSKAGLIFDEPADWVRMISENGIKLFRVPDIPFLYGELAGKYIPRYAANTFLRAIETGDPHWYNKALANLRVGWLANPATISRNITGGLLMMNAAGLSAKEIAENGVEALILLKQINATGDITILGPGAEALNLFGEGTLAAEASDKVSRALEEILGSIGRNRTQEAVARIKKFAADVFTGRPLFDLFQYSEDTMRLTTFLAVRKRLMSGLGREVGQEDLEKINRIAATIANNILFDYSSQPEMVRVLKRTGLMMFPSFSVFNIGRTARLVLTRPQVFANIQHLTNASYGLLPEEERQMAALAVGVSWMADEQPLFLGQDEDGSYIVVPLRNLFPRIASLDFTQTAYEPLTGGILQGIIDAAVAWSSGTGEGPFSKRYGQRVFEVGAPTTTQIAQTALFAYRKYSPGWQRSAIDAMDHLSRRVRSKNPDAVFKTFGKTYSRSPDVLLIRNLGIPYYKTSVGRYAKSIDAIDDKYQRAIAQVKRDLMQAALAGDQMRVRILSKRIINLRKMWIEELKRAVEGKR